MASNARTQARKVARARRDSRWMTKFQRDFGKVYQPGETHRTHYVGGGQEFSKKKGEGEDA